MLTPNTFRFLYGIRDASTRADINLEEVSDFPFILWSCRASSFAEGTSPRVEVQVSRTGRPRLDEDFITISLVGDPEVLNGDLFDIEEEEFSELKEFTVLCREPLHQYWCGDLSSQELYDEVKTLNETIWAKRLDET
jgi:hypothetical protein